MIEMVLHLPEGFLMIFNMGDNPKPGLVASVVKGFVDGTTAAAEILISYIKGFER